MKASVAVCKNIREIVDFINSNDIHKEDIVNLIDKEGMLFLIYFK